MDIKIKSQPVDLTHYIHGTTNINHQIRVRLGLQVHEYCLLDFLSGWWSKNKRIPLDSDYYNWMGVRYNDIMGLLAKLEISGFLEYGKWNEADMLSHFPSMKWKEAFELTDEFEVLWKLHAKGNKKTAKQRFSKAIKKIRFTDLKRILESYITSNEFQYLKGLDVWLNPDKEHWNDPIVSKVTGKAVDLESPPEIFFD